MKQQIELERKEWGTIAKCHTVRGGGIELDTQWDQSLSKVKSEFLYFCDYFTRYFHRSLNTSEKLSCTKKETSKLSLLILVTNC